jgi:hypothetical protein
VFSIKSRALPLINPRLAAMPVSLSITIFTILQIKRKMKMGLF